MKSPKLVVSILSVVVCGLFAFSIGLSAQASGTARISKAAPIADVQKFESAFSERLNQVIRDRGAVGKPNAAQIAGKKIWKNIVDYFVWKTGAKVAPKDVVELSNEDLKKLGDLVKSRFDQAIRTKNTSALGEGELTQSFFTGKLLNKETSGPSVKDSTANEKKN